MKLQLQLYTRRSCCLCEEMKQVIREAANRFPLALEETDVDDSAEIQALYGTEVPVLFINGRKAFKYRVTLRDLQKRLQRESRASPWSKWKKAALKRFSPER
jgi:glutaredoxin